MIRRTLRRMGSRFDTRLQFLWTSIAIFVVLTLVLFWRYAFAPTTTVSDPGDPILLIWVMEWVQHALLHTPGGLFDAPMFHPFSDTLAYSDPLLPQSLLALPIRALGFGPVFAYNSVFIGGIVVTGVLSTLLFLELTEDRAVALVAAVVATFPALRLYHLAHMQLQVTLFWPLALLLVHRIVRDPRVTACAGLAFTLAGAALASLYHGMFMALLLPPFALVAWGCSRERHWRSLLSLAAAGLAAGVMLYPIGRVYGRAIGHLAQQRAHQGFSDVSHYLGISPFSDLSHWLSGRVVYDAAPQWIGGGAAWLLPIALIATGVVAIRRRVIVRNRTRTLPEWARLSLPYAVLGCSALLLSFGPELTWRGRGFTKNPLAAVTRAPGVREIRDFQRAGFAVAFAGAGVLAVGLAELVRRRQRRLAEVGQVVAALSTVVPFFSSSLPGYRPPAFAELAPVYRWLAAQPERMVVFEVPLERHSELQPLEFLWASVHHKKVLVHGFSGYLPLTDIALRDEAAAAHRADFFRTLALLGTTHLVVHTERLSSIPGGEASLASLREARGADRVARFATAEIYRIEAPRFEQVDRVEPTQHQHLPASGGVVDRSGRCEELRPDARPLVLQAPLGSTITGLSFIAQMRLSDLDTALRVERSADLQVWRPASHRPLLSESLVAYVEKPAPMLRARAVLKAEAGTFARLSTARNLRLRLCDLEVETIGSPLALRVPSRSLRLSASASQDRARLAIDGNPSTRWNSTAPQNGNEWMIVDLGGRRHVSAVVLELGHAPRDYARELTLDCGDASAKLEPFHELEGRTAMIERPLAKQIIPVVPPKACRWIRVRQTGRAAENEWSVAELVIYEHAAQR